MSGIFRGMRRIPTSPIFHRHNTFSNSLARRNLLQQARFKASNQPGYESAPIVQWSKNQFRLAQFFAFGAVNGLLQHYYGDTKPGEHYYHYRFVHDKKWTEDDELCDNLSDFYGGEDLMQIFSVLPFMEKLMMRGGSFDDDGTVHTWGLGGKGAMLVSMDFTEGEELEGDDSVIGFFNKRERFHDLFRIPFTDTKFTLWDKVDDFGYHQKKDGTVVIYQTGVSFKGPWILRLFWHLHSWYVAKATIKYLNTDVFGDSDRLEEAEHIRHEIPLYALEEFVQSVQKDLEAVVADQLKKGDKEAHRQAEKALREMKKVRNTLDLSKTKKTLTIRTQETSKGKIESARLNLNDKELSQAVSDATQVISSHGHGAGVTNQPLQKMAQTAAGKLDIEDERKKQIF